jgi:ribosomal protein L29
MALLRMEEIKKLSEKERKEKMQDLKLELVKSNVTANKTNAKTKEIKRAISRLLTFNKTSKEGELRNNK